MSAEVTVKKRGRPSKKAAIENGRVLVPQGGSIPPTPKTNTLGKTTAKTSNPAATSSSIVSPNSTSTAKKAKKDVEDLSPVTKAETKSSPATKRKATVKISGGSTTPPKSAEKVATTTSKGLRPHAKALDSKEKVSPPVTEGTKWARAVAECIAEAPAAPPASSPKEIPCPQRQRQSSLRESEQTVQIVRRQQALSKIVQQAKAFSRQSSELQLRIVELLGEREAVSTLRSTHDRNSEEARESKSQFSSEADAASTPAAEVDSASKSRLLDATATVAASLSTGIPRPPSPQIPAEITQPILPQTTIPPSPNTPPPASIMSSILKTTSTSTSTPQIRAYSSTSPSQCPRQSPSPPATPTHHYHPVLLPQQPSRPKFPEVPNSPSCLWTN